MSREVREGGGPSQSVLLIRIETTLQLNREQLIRERPARTPCSESTGVAIMHRSVETRVRRGARTKWERKKAWLMMSEWDEDRNWKAI